jgi:hypothetical protein
MADSCSLTADRNCCRYSSLRGDVANVLGLNNKKATTLLEAAGVQFSMATRKRGSLLDITIADTRDFVNFQWLKSVLDNRSLTADSRSIFADR